ncbi:MAG: hypothetical protein HQM08_30385 [Candidatus Riflebacteria bacterium]|nr:hypothetical protein [Candidatus Riflebacteria bacterium]
MDKRNHSTLIKSVDFFTQNEICLAPELLVLFALDANLLAVIKKLDFEKTINWTGNCSMERKVEKHITNTIFILAKALRKNLSAYYAIVKENSRAIIKQEEIPF